MRPTALDLLKGARNLIHHPRNWMQGDYNDGPDQTAFCAVGAIHHMADGAYASQREKAYEALLSAIPEEDKSTDFLHNPEQAVVQYNDNVFTTHEEILAVFDKAITAKETT